MGWRTAGSGLVCTGKRGAGSGERVVDEAGGKPHVAGWLDVGGLGSAENRAAWTRASGLEEREDDGGSGPRCSGRVVWDTRQSSWSSSARLSLARSALRFKYTNFTCSEMKGEE